MRDRAAQGGSTTWTANNATMQADRQDFRLTGASFSIKFIKAVLKITFKLRAVGEPRLNAKPHVVAVHCIGHDQLIGFAKAGPIRQVIAIAIRNIRKLVCLSGKAYRVVGTAPRIPTAWRSADDFGVQTNGLHNLGAFLVLGHVFMLDPFQAMTSNFPP